MNFKSTYGFFDEDYTDAQKKAIASFCKNTFPRGTNYAYAFIVKYNLAYVVDDTADCMGFVTDALKECLGKLGKLDAKGIYNALHEDKRLWYTYTDNSKKFLLDVSTKKYSIGSDCFTTPLGHGIFNMAAENGKIYGYPDYDPSIPEEVLSSDNDNRPSVTCLTINEAIKDNSKTEVLKETIDDYGYPTYRFALEDIHAICDDAFMDVYNVIQLGTNRRSTIIEDSQKRVMNDYLIPLLRKNGEHFNCSHMEDFKTSLVEIFDGVWTHDIGEFPEDFFNKTYETLGKLGEIYEQTSDRNEFLEAISAEGPEAFALGPALIWEYYDGTQTLESEEEYHKEIAEAYKDLKAKFLNADDNFDDTLKELDALDSEEEDSEESEEN